MQKIEFKESPSPHVVIQNFMPLPAARECLEEAQSLESVYVDARVGASPESSFDASHIEGCEECENQINVIRKSIRSNKIIHMDAHYRDRRNKSKILQHLNLALTVPPLLDAFEGFPNLFPIITQTSHMETIISSYGMCDFYGWHTDTLSESLSARILTCVLHWNTEPKEYEGGELILTGKTIEDQLAYPPVHNTAIFFESNKLVHAVNETKHEGDFKDSRFSINLWLGFDGAGNKYR